MINMRRGSWLAFLTFYPVFLAVGQPSGTSIRCGLTVQHTAACMVSVDELVVKGEFFDGKIISLIGYMSIDSHRLTVYASKYAYENLDERRSVVIRGAADDLKRWSEKYRNQVVRVTGEFRVHLGPGEGDYRAGSILLVAPPLRLGQRVMDEASTVIGYDPSD